MATVVLIGPMASGKTKVGKRVAKRLNVEHIDTDKTIVAENGPISAIFEERGEPEFRRIERDHVAKALETSAVVSLGGGAVLDSETQRDLTGAHVVYLTVSPEAVKWRLAGGKRPLVAQGGVERWRQIFEERKPLYERLADRTFDTSSGRLDSIAQQICEWVEAGYPQEKTAHG